ncbi:MAG: hypothetical protein M1831_002793 [Alyxoria varia]|nr:MAG: hypothetical protein M1831_002793 [Alyxoria varia]
MSVMAHKLAQFASELRRRSHPHSSSARLAMSRQTAPCCICQPGRYVHSGAAQTAAEDGDLPAAMLDRNGSSNAPHHQESDTTSHAPLLPLDRIKPIHSRTYQLSYSPPRPPHIASTPGGRRTTETPTEDSSTDSQPPPLSLTANLRTLLPQLSAQPPFYITIHIHGFPYLVTAGDTVRLPFLMHGVLPGDILRLNRASRIGSRDWTLLAGRLDASPSSSQEQQQQPPDQHDSQILSPPSSSYTDHIIGRTHDLPPHALPASHTAPKLGSLPQAWGAQSRKKGPLAHLDDRLFVCRATVLGTESEPMRFKEKTKRRQRHVRRVKSKHRFTVIRVSEVRVRGLAELEDMGLNERAGGGEESADGAGDGLEGTG